MGSVDGLVNIQYNGAGSLMDKGLHGEIRAVPQMHVLHITLPLGINLEVNEWNEPGEGSYMNIRITMPAQPGQDGHCGNSNGNPADDDRLQIRARIGTTGVEPAQMLFPGPKTPVGESNRPDINNCPRPKLESAKANCKEKEGKFIPSMSCLIDVCFGGDGFAAEAGAEGM